MCFVCLEGSLVSVPAAPQEVVAQAAPWTATHVGSLEGHREASVTSFAAVRLWILVEQARSRAMQHVLDWEGKP